MEEMKITAAVDTLQHLFESAHEDLEKLGDLLDDRISMNFQKLGDDESLGNRAIKLIQDTTSTLKNVPVEYIPDVHDEDENQIELMKIRELLGLPKIDEKADDDQDMLQTTYDCDEENQIPKNSNSMLLSPKAPERKQNGKSGRKRVPAQKQEKPPKKLTPVTENEFNSVSELIRGRCQLQDVNKVYEVLYQYFSNQKKKKSRFQTAQNRRGQTSRSQGVETYHFDQQWGFSAFMSRKNWKATSDCGRMSTATHKRHYAVHDLTVEVAVNNTFEPASDACSTID
eukprot:gene7847-681_t